MSTAVLDSPADVLGHVAGARAARDAAEVDIAVGALQWAYQHPADSIHTAAILDEHRPIFGTEQPVALAGEGAPLVAEFAGTELATVLGISSEAGDHLIGDVLNLAHRLPRTWARVLTGDVTVWRARKIAQATHHLPPPAALWVDAQVAWCAPTMSWAQLDRVLTEAAARLDPDHLLADADRHHREVHFRYDNSGPLSSTAEIHGTLDLVDARDLDTLLSAEATRMQAAGAVEDHHELRAVALGHLARGDQGLDYTGSTSNATTTADRNRRHGHGVDPATLVTRTIVLHVHLSQQALTGTAAPLGWMESPDRLVALASIERWCSTATTVTINPVLDLAGHQHTTSYAIPDRLREQVIGRDRHCVFPWCTRAARACDLDHSVPWAPGDDTHPDDAEPNDVDGQTESDNLAPLCRRHHRIKTHSTWTYLRVRQPDDPPGGAPAYEWTSPHGHTYTVTPTGTLAH